MKNCHWRRQPYLAANREGGGLGREGGGQGYSQFSDFWDAEVLDSRINRPDFYRKSNERVMRDSSFYYDGAHSKEIYMGWKERDDVCRLPQLLHPIKRVN